MNEPFSSNPNILTGTVCFTGTRIPVAAVLRLLDRGWDDQRIRTEAYPELTEEHLAAARQYREALARGQERPLA